LGRRLGWRLSREETFTISKYKMYVEKYQFLFLAIFSLLHTTKFETSEDLKF
jgi:hypothetical protein